MTRRLLLAAALACLAYGSASAQLLACVGDVKKHCPGMAPGDGRIVRCLEQNKSTLSPGCKAAMGMSSGGAASGPPSAADACRGDAMKFCQSSGGDREQVKACLVQHAAQLSDGCKTAMIQAGAAGK